MRKMDRSIHIIDRISRARSGVVSAQVLGETYSNIVKPEKLAMTPVDAMTAIETIAGTYFVAPLTLEFVQDAMRISPRYQMSYYDALLIAAAKAQGASTLVTEDLQAEQVIDGVRILHVLDDDFDLSRLD
jgi:predicted nucleic acid-binding protein